MTDICSMTGFGAASAEADGYFVKMEIKSVNNRGMKITVRARPSLGSCEKKLRDYIAAELRRGAVDVYASVERPASTAVRPIRDEAATKAVESLRRLAAGLGLPDDLTAGDLVHIPGVFDLSAEDPISDEEWGPVEKVMIAAVAQVKAMRLAEGSKLAELLLGQADPLEAFVRATNVLAPRALVRARDRLERRLAEICPNGFNAADNQALEREMCLIADRADIREELDRLESHIAQFRGVIAGGGEIGKRLEFLAQEFLREINTTASKTNDTEIVQGAVLAKLVVEVIKEQSANIV